MYKRNGKLIYSPTDLTTFMQSPFASWMDRLRIEVPDQAPEVDQSDALNVALQQRGYKHEATLLAEFKSQGRNIVYVTEDHVGKDASLEQKHEVTLAAMRSGADVIFQAALKCGPIFGYADFLIKVAGKSGLGEYHYEVWDTKLASKVKPYFVIQLCCYAEMLVALQGVLPERIAVALGNGKREFLKTREYFYYYLALRQRFLDTQASFDITAMPDPFESKSYGRWSEYAEQLLRERDHLSAIANISRSQIKKLNQAGIYTCAGLIGSSQRTVRGLTPAIFQTLKAQASIQKASGGNIPPLFEVLDPKGGLRGLALLPSGSPLDIYFDIEGFPLDEGGLEYLWGSTYFDEHGERQFKEFWAHNPEQEKAAFGEFIQWAYARWQQDPSMHIYHYANYEIAACRKLMGRYGICEHEVDQLLRNEVFVDLYKIVKGGLLLGEPRYSIKNVEHLYREKRETDVGSGGESVVAYEQWRENPDGDDWTTSKILGDIRAYNIDDCESTQELTAWLRDVQLRHGISPYAGKEDIVEPDLSDEVNKRTQLRDRLLARADTEDPTIAEVTKNLAWVLEFHRRELKPTFWRLFDRLGMSHEELIDDIDCLAACQRTDRPEFKPTPKSRNFAFEYQFDRNQEFKAPRGDASLYLLGEDRKKVTLLMEHSDIGAGRIVVQAKEYPGDLISLLPDEYVNPEPIPAAVDAVVASYEANPNQQSAIFDFLFRRIPRIQGHQGPIVVARDPAQRLEEIINAALNLDYSYLTIQGPPGSGKTYTGARIIARLLQQGKRIGISSNSHKAINNLLVSAAAYCREQGIAANFFCTQNTGPEIEVNGITVIKNSDIAVGLNNCCVVGTTAWGFCRTDLAGEFDYLFVDEAGQVALAKLIGMSRSARNIILMGDQMQLGQPIQGTHPAESGASILDYLLHDTAIIPAEMGVFLGTTFRMHSAVNAFISEAIYEGQLHSDERNDTQSVAVPENYRGELNFSSGFRFVPVHHEGNTQASDEEVEVISTLVRELLGRIYTDKNGQEKPIGWEDILFIAPYNHQVNKLKEALDPRAKVGSVDKFQGQEAPIVFFSLCTSDAAESARGIDFIFDKQRINVAMSRAQAMAIAVGNPGLFSAPVGSLSHMRKINVLARLVAH